MFDGGRDFGRPGSILRKKGADRPGVPCAHRRSGEPSDALERRRGTWEATRDERESSKHRIALKRQHFRRTERVWFTVSKTSIVGKNTSRSMTMII